MYSGDEIYGDEITSPLDERDDIASGEVWPEEEEETPVPRISPETRRHWARQKDRYGMDPGLFS